jgi:hypothetical protein
MSFWWAPVFLFAGIVIGAFLFRLLLLSDRRWRP